jgi:phosphoribosylformimino-5-aminoimidazole carboxamide ribotide isomerase
MIVIPAIDIINKKVVRLTQGDFARETCYSSDPVDVALKWQSQGAELIHIVDLDGARFGEPRNIDIVKQIIDKIDVPMQLGGGLRTKKDIDMALSSGVSKVIVGTKAAVDIDFIKGLLACYGDKIIVSIDAVGIDVMASGWGEEIPKTAVNLANEIADIGVKTIIFSNIRCDGTLEGINEYWVRDMLSAAGDAQVIIAGGVSSVADIMKIKEISVSNKNLYGIITGKAIYEGRLDLAQAISILKGD